MPRPSPLVRGRSQHMQITECISRVWWYRPSCSTRLPHIAHTTPPWTPQSVSAIGPLVNRMPFNSHVENKVHEVDSTGALNPISAVSTGSDVSSNVSSGRFRGFRTSHFIPPSAVRVRLGAGEQQLRLQAVSQLPLPLPPPAVNQNWLPRTAQAFIHQEVRDFRAESLDEGC